MRLIGVLLILLLIADLAINNGSLFNQFKSLEYPLPILVQILYLIIAVLAVILIIHAIIMEWNLVPKIRIKKTLFEEALDREGSKSKKHKGR